MLSLKRKRSYDKINEEENISHKNMIIESTLLFKFDKTINIDKIQEIVI